MRIEKALSDFPGYAQRFRRADHRRLFSRFQCEPRSGRALWPNGGRRQRRHRNARSAARRLPPRSKAASAIRSASATRVISAKTSTALKRVLVPGATPGIGREASRGGPQPQVPSRCLPTSATRPGRPPSATRTANLWALFSSTSRRATSRLCARRASQAHQRTRQVPARLLHRNGPDSFEYLKAAQKRLKLVIPFTLLIIFVLIYMNTKSVDEDHHRPARRSVFAGRRILAALFARLQHECRRLGRHHRARRARCRDRGRHASLPGSRLGKISRPKAG